MSLFAGKKAPKKAFKAAPTTLDNKAKGTGAVTDYANEYSSFADDVIGDDSASDEEDTKGKKSKRRHRDEEEDNEEKSIPYMLFDFRKGKEAWPETAQLVDQKTAEQLLEKAVAAAEEAAKLKKKEGEENEDTGKKSSGSGGVSWGDSDEIETVATGGLHPEASFETLSDGSQALIIKPGFRLKLDVSDLERGGDEKKEERRKEKEKEKKKAAKYKGKSSSYADMLGDDIDIWDATEEDFLRKYFKNYINAYTITMDIKLLEEIPREGISLFQTALIHSKENKRTGKTVLSKSDGECIISQSGGVGMFGTYGDTTKAKVEVGCWRRVVISVKCVEGANEKGEMRTWVNTEAGAVLKEDLIVANERFAIDPTSLFFFSSAQSGMMPGNIAVRTIRIDAQCSTDETVKANRARDKLSSMFDEERKKEIEEQRKGLSLASLFPKPRPMWVAPAFVAAFGDCFIERTSLEGSSNLAWSYTVLNFALQRMVKNPIITGDFGLDYTARVGVSDALHILQQSNAVFKLMLRMLKTPSESQLLSFLRKLKKLIQAVNIGETLLLPGLVEQQELIIILERTSDRFFKAVIVNTDATGGLQFHASSPTEAMPEIYYRTGMVLTEIPKKNVYDDVFWLAFYNMAINQQEEDIVKFYDVLVPFLTGKPLESSLVEAERIARGLSSHGISVDADPEGGGDASVSRLQKQLDILKGCGSFRAPQRSKTAYVQCIFEALNFILRSRSLTESQADLVQFGLCIELVSMMKNDLSCMLPDDNGVRVCSLALRELSRFAITLVNKIENQGSEESKHEEAVGKAVNVADLLTITHDLVDTVNELLAFCRNHDDDLPPPLDLSGPTDSDPHNPLLTQYKDMLAWETSFPDPDPGQEMALRKYIPVDLLQIPKKAATRKEAIRALRMCDKLVTLLGNQSHCIKNDKFLILAAIEHLFVQVIPVPKPRGITLSEQELYTSGRAGRRAEVKEAKNKVKAEEKKKKMDEKKIRDEIENENRRRARQANGLEDEEGDSFAQEKSASKANSSKAKESAGEDKDTPAPVKCFGEEVDPDFDIGKACEKEAVDSPCIWDEPLHYELQVELLLVIQRLAENFAAAAMSIQQSRPFDAVCIIVPACMACLADAIVRKAAIDEPSEFCCHLMGRTVAGIQLGHPGFGISAGSFATQSETIEIHYTELSIARTAVLDYFHSPLQQRLQKIFSFEDEFILKPGKNLIKLLRMVSREIGLAIGRPQMLIVDSKPMSSLLMKNYPELRCYRDIVFWWKYFMNTDRKVFPNYVPLENPREVSRIDRMSSQLDFNWDENSGGYDVQSFGMSLKCRPDPNQVDPTTGKPFLPEQLPTHRFPSTATPSFYVPLPLIKTEDDVIYRPNLPSFEDRFGQVLNQRDSELLISYLTVPYMRLPLLLSFFSTEDRIHKLQSKELRLILDSVLFEPGKYLRLDMCGVVPTMVPTNHHDLLATSYGLLVNELVRSPDTVLRAVTSLLKGALACDTGSVVDEGATEFNTSTKIILYITRMGCRIDNYLSFLIDWATNSHDCIDCPLRETDISEEVLAALKQGQADVRQLLDGQYHPLFEDYLRRLDVQVSQDPTNEKLIDRNSALACDLHSHKLLLYRNYHEYEFKPSIATTLVGSFVYLTTRHTWNKSTTEGARLNMPETELYELLQVSRRRLIAWISSCKQGILDEVMQTALQVSSSLTGSLKASAQILDSQNRWSRIKGERSCGRWAVGSSRTVAVDQNSSSSSGKPGDSDDDLDVPPPAAPGKMQRQISYEKTVGEVDDTGLLGVEIDIQMGQMTLRSKHLAALATEIANHPDVMLIFGDATMQASLIERAEHRQKYRLVGLNHELHYWPTAHGMCPPLADQWEREYDPKDLFESEKWIANLFEPIRLSFFNGPRPEAMQFLMPEKALSKDAEVAVLLGLHQIIGGPWKLVYLFRRLRCVHIYECVSQGREWWYSLHMTTDYRYTLREMQPNAKDRKAQFPEWWIRGSGDPYPMNVNPSLVNDIDGHSQQASASVLVVREQQHHLNYSGGQETLVPARLLYGVIPEALLDAYIFWQDESIAPRGTPVDEFERATFGHKRLHGYPKAADGEFVIVVEFRSTGSWSDFVAPQSGVNHPHVVQCTGLPGRTVTVTRKSKAQFLADFQRRQRIAQLLESTKLLINPPPKKKAEADDGEKQETFKIDADVECDYEGKGAYWPCIVRRVNDNGTYDLEYVKDYKWVGVQRGVDPDIVQKRGEDERRKRGEGVWHWDGMSESEDDDWRANSDDEAENEDPDKQIKSRLSFYHFDELNILLEAAGGDEASCLAAISRLASVPGVLPFTDIHKLARSISELVSRDNLGFNLQTSDKSPATQDDDMILLNLLYAPRRSRLHSILKTLARIENASHICAWTKASNVKQRRGPSEGLPYGCPPVDLIEIPRLKLAFNARYDHNGELRLYSVDHVDLFITNESNAFTAKLIAGIPHSLLLSNVRGEAQVLVPVIPPKRPRIAMEPFSTFIVLDRTKIPLAERFFLYPVHVSLSFLLTKGLNSAVYLMLLRFLHRDYAEVFRLADSIATDTKFNSEGQDIFMGFKNSNDDWHPDAHACRLKISLVTIDSGTESPWDLTVECAKHTVKLAAVSSSCRLAPQEELQILESESVATSNKSPCYNYQKHSEYAMALCFNRQQLLRGVLKRQVADSIEVACRVPPRAISSNWPYYQDNTVFGENYSQMQEIVSATEGDHSWVTEMKGQGGDETDAPPGGWLVVVCFHTLWSAGCLKCMPGVTELVPMYQDMVNFLSVRADCQGMISISRKYDIKTFPTFLILRGGQVLERFEGSERVVENLVRLIGLHLKPSDKMAHSKHNHRIKMEKALLLGLEAPEEEPEERGQLDWTWDPDNCGEAMRVEQDGMQAIIGDQDGDDDRVSWEYSYNNRNNWVQFAKDINKKLETRYKAGEMYSSSYYDSKYEIYCNNIEITSWSITGWYGTEMSSYRTIYVRRTGDRLSVPGEEPYLSKEQKEKDKRSAEWREKLAAFRLKIKQEKVGKDIEGMRGSIGMLPNTGKHIWTLRVNHEPPRFGTSTGVGICSDACESFGPAQGPLLGGDGDSGSSLALYANGDLYHNGHLLHKFHGTRNIPFVEEAKSATQAAISEEEKGAEEDEVIEEVDYTTIVEGTRVEGNHKGNGRWYDGIATKCNEDGTFSIRYNDGDVEENVQKDFIRVLGAAAFAALQPGGAARKVKPGCRVSGNSRGFGNWHEGTCITKNADKTFDVEYDDGEIERNISADRIKYLKKARKSAKAADENTVPVENRAPLFGRKSTVCVEFDSAENGGSIEFIVDGVRLEGYAIQNIYKLLGGNEVFPCVCLCPFDLIDETTRAKQAEEARVKAETEAAERLAEQQEREENGDYDNDEDCSDDEEEGDEGGSPEPQQPDPNKKDDFIDDEYPSITLLPYDDGKKESEEPAEPVVQIDKFESKYVDAKAEAARVAAEVSAQAAAAIAESKDESSSESKEQLEDATAATEVAPAEASASDEAEAKSTVPDPAAATQQADKVVEVPIEKIRWMYESDAGWNIYTPAASRELEEALRDGKSEYTITLGNNSHKCNLDTKKQTRSDNENESRMRRHVMGDGISAMWEILTMKYEKPSNFISGASAVKILQKIWSSKETMSGKEAGFGFLFLYSLLSGDMRCRIVGGSSGEGRGSYGSYGPQPMNQGGSFTYGGKTVSTGSNDSHRFALLMTQLYADKHTKSLPGSIINVLGRNRQVSLRMPKFKDTRKATQTPFFNGWIDENEPRSPLAELMGKVVPLMTLMKRKGTFHFPPPPPHAELPAAPSNATIHLVDSQAANVDWDRPELSDFACESRVLRPVDPSVIGQLATLVKYRLGEDELKPSPPIAIEDTAHFEKVIKDAGERIIVVDFFATWCGPCQSLAPVFKLLALQTPIAVFLKVDVDVCDDLTSKFKIETMPHTVFLRGGHTPGHIRTQIKGGGPEYVEEFMKAIAHLATDDEKETLKRFQSNTPGANVKAIVQNMSSNDAEVEILANEPLKDCSKFVSLLTRSELELPRIQDELAFDVSNHDSAKTAPAVSVLNRFKDDVKAFADAVNTTKMPKMVRLTDLEINRYFAGEEGSEEVLKLALAGTKELMTRLQELRDADTKMLQDLIPLLEKCCNWIEMSESDSDIAKIAKTKFKLSRIAGQNSFVWVEFLFGSLLSSKGEEDLLHLNPYLSATNLKSILGLVTTSMLRANRLGHTNRCIGTVIALEGLLNKTLKLGLADRATQGTTLTPKLIQLGEDLAKNLSMKRYYMKPLEAASGMVSTKYEFDPRYLVFEFVWNIQLRQKQVEIVNDFRNCLANNKSKVKQMIMGAGKTSVVAPLLALIVADGKSLVLSVVPKALVEMSRTRMRETFAVIMVKRIYTLDFDRSTTVKPAMRRSLENAAANRGVVVATPTTLKSIMLSYLEVLQHLRDAHAGGLRSQLESLKLQAEELAKILTLFKEGVMLLDEVDLILHPLKSELNFPIGDKFDLDGSEDGERWGLPIHLMDALFFTSTGKVSTFEQRGTALEILKKLAAVVQQGIVDRNLQRLPHVTLLNPDFYHTALKPIMAEWAYLWLQKQHLHGIDRNEAVRYMLEGAAARSDNTTKLNCIEIALKKAQVDAGVEPEEPSPTRGFVRSMSAEVRDQVAHTMRKLQRSRSESVSHNSDLSNLLNAQIHHLEAAQKSAITHSHLVNELYGIDEIVEGRTSNSTKLISTVQAKIAMITKQISDIECPRDDSLDNSIIVWCSQAFASTTGAGAGGAGANNGNNGKTGESSVPAVCTILEDMGFTVKRCADSEEAISRARDLQAEKQLRCIIIGGDERVATCGPNCNKAHLTGNCVKCNRPWGNHCGHNCTSGGRGSWPLDGPGNATPKVFNAEQIYKTLTDEETPYARANGALPALRTAVYTAHCTMKEDERMAFWKLGTNVTDDPKGIVEWVSSLPSWNAGENKVEDVDENEDDADLAPSAPIAIKRESSLVVDKNKIASLKAELEKLENEKAAILDEEESQLKVSQTSAADKNAELEASVSSRLEVLVRAESKLKDLVEAFNSRISESTKLQYFDPLSKLWMGPHNGRDAALALAWLDVHASSLDELVKSGAVLEESLHKTLLKHFSNIGLEINFLRQLSLAAKVVAHVTSPAHKKLLNLCHNWLATFLPHCLAKVNRVSFGLLSAEDCKAALEADPHVPRSRLKLAVPFVGKDVPSKSSEFAHPDVIIGLTVLAYRYSGLRRDDFIDIVDSLTAQFSVEIGPARDRESSLRHERWVHAAGGAIRGLKGTRDGKPWAITIESSADPNASKEVVQLKFLQKSNEEQMQKLFELIMLEPLVIHHYLTKTIFPLHMRSQRLKLSASGQAVGGDMLVGKRVGFSGTPSDLLPEELGRCDYETGDDGMMISTVLDRKVASFEYLKDKWTVEHILEQIATSESPRFHALIDTGALITGYSNQEVAQQLLDRGLTWCEGVVFLDDDDRQQVLVRATGRVVSADQCGVSLERRFAFYDQIHTTGMDIKHVVNATAVITLGKDMVFRDYVQGAYRMRGIGAGQKVHVFVIPEVRELISRELKDCTIVGPTGNPADEHVLEDIVAWLVVNSLRSEQTQWTMLCLQNIGNLYRKQAFRCLHKNTKYFTEGLCAINIPDSGTIATSSTELEAFSLEDAANTSSNAAAGASTKLTIAEIASVASTAAKAHSTARFEEDFVDSLDKKSSLELFDESIDFSLDSGVPDPVPFATKLRSMLDDHEGFLLPHQHAIGHNILVVVGQFSMIEGSANRLDTEQEREQEQEQEKEVEARRDQQIEVEKFVDREYSRQEEVQRPWPFSMLAKSIDTPGLEHPFYQLKDFKLRHQEPLEFDDILHLSTNYFNPNWNGLRRVKNVIMVLEYAPSTDSTDLRLRSSDEARVKLSADQEIALRKAHTLLGFHANAAGLHGVLNRNDIKNAVGAVLDIKEPSDSLVDEIVSKFSGDKTNFTLDEFRELLSSGYLYPKHKGRHWVAVSLAEAETIRRILHLRKRFDNQNVIPNSSTELALRYSPVCGPACQSAGGDGGVVFDASWGWQRNGSGATTYEASVVHSSFRFFDCDMHYSEASLNILVQVLRSSIRDRERFFLATIGCRRRMERKWQDTPLSKVFSVPDEWVSLKQKSQSLFVIEALKARNLTLWEAFTAFDYDNNGMLSPAEFYGALIWLGVPNLTADDVVDFIEAVDKNRDGMIDYKEYMDMLAGAEETEEVGDGAASSEVATEDNNRVPIAKVEPHGADELREIMVRRKQAEMARIREDRIRKQAYKDALDVKVFEEELEASKKRKGGANPLVYTVTYPEPVVKVPDATVVAVPAEAGEAAVETVVEAVNAAETHLEVDVGITGPQTVTDFKFHTNQLPLRCAVTGKSSFLPIHAGTLADKPVKPLMCKRKHKLTQYNYYWACCELCRKQSTAWACWSCSYFVCAVCFDGDKKGKEAERRDPAKHPTFLRCVNGCSFTLQVPTAGGANPTTGDYSVTLEMRLEKLPPKDNLHSLFRFTTPDHTQARRVHRTSVFINPEGRIVGRPLLTGGEASEKASKLIPSKWNIVTVAVQPEKGLLKAYINGALCHVSANVDAADLRLQHKLVVLGGGKQAQSRGGDVRRLLIHGSALTPTEVMAVFIALANEHPGLGQRVRTVQALYRGFKYRKAIKDKEAAEKAAEEAAAAAAAAAEAATQSSEGSAEGTVSAAATEAPVIGSVSASQSAMPAAAAFGTFGSSPGLGFGTSSSPSSGSFGTSSPSGLGSFGSMSIFGSPSGSGKGLFGSSTTTTAAVSAKAKPSSGFLSSSKK